MTTSIYIVYTHTLEAWWHLTLNHFDVVFYNMEEVDIKKIQFFGFHILFLPMFLLFWHFTILVFLKLQGQSKVSNEKLDLHSFIDVQGLWGIGKDLRNMTNINVSQEDICALFGPRFDKNKWKYKSQTIIEFQSIIKSLYTHVFRKYHVLNETLLLKFACGVVVENNGIKVNWVAYAYLVYKRQ
jgi:hypothetical protein